MDRGHRRDALSPIASAMGHHLRRRARQPPLDRGQQRARAPGVPALSPPVVGVCSLPQSPGVSPGVRGGTGAVRQRIRVRRLQPPPTPGGYWTDPPLGDEWWYPAVRETGGARRAGDDSRLPTCNPRSTPWAPLSERRQHASSSCWSRASPGLPRLRIILAHGGGNVPFRPRVPAWEHHPRVGVLRRLPRAVPFRHTVYSQEAMDLLIKVVGVDRIIYASEMLGA